MKILLFSLQKEFRQMFRDKIILAMMFVLPIIQLIIMPLAANFEVKSVNMVYFDQDNSAYSAQLLAKIKSSGKFHVVESSISYSEAMENIARSKADLILTIPADFERNLVRNQHQNVQITLDAINAMKSAIGSGYLAAVIADFNTQIGSNASLIDAETKQAIKYININSSSWFNPKAEYKYFMVPAILVLLLTIVGGFLAALNIVREKEIGTMEQINVTPIKKWQFILSKLIPFWIVGLIVFSVGLLVMRIVYGIIPVGSIPLLYLFAAVYMIAILGFGLLVSTFANTQLQAMFIAFFFIMIFILMSGLFTSIDSMPDWSKTIAEFTPVTHFIKVVRMIVLKGSEFAHLKMELLYLVIFAVVLNTAAVLNYKKTN